VVNSTSITTVKYALAERHIYGSSRLGMDTTEVVVPQNEMVIAPTSETTIARHLKKKLYELSNHLGNVLTVISDMKVPVGNEATGVLEYYNPHIISVTDYSPFGVALSARTWSEQEYRFGFQAQEQDEEMWGGSVTYKYRVEDPRLGRFFSVDPLYAKYPWNSNYAFSENRLLDAIELEGLEAYYIHGTVKSAAGDYTGKVHSHNMLPEDLEHIGEVFDNTSINRGFNWSGENSDQARHTAAQELAAHIIATRDKTGKEQITLVGHSHGGNVAIEAANILMYWYNVPADQINIVALNTPREYDIELKDDKVDMYAVSAEGDAVQYWGSDATWDEFGDINVQKRDVLITYTDQVTEDYDEFCGIQQNHCGWEPRNVKVWLPILKAMVPLHVNQKAK